MRGKKRGSNAVPGEVCIKVLTVLARMMRELIIINVRSYYFEKTIKHLDSQLNITILYDTFCNKHPGIKVSYFLQEIF